MFWVSSTRRRQIGAGAFAGLLATLIPAIQGPGDQAETYVLFGLAGVSLVIVIWAVLGEVLGQEVDSPALPETQAVAEVGEAQAATGGHNAQTAGGDAYMAGRDINIVQAATDPGNPVARALADAETELLTIRSRTADALADGFFPVGFMLPADRRKAASHGLADHGLDTVRRQVDNAYIECDRLNTRLNGRFWTEGPMPEPGPASVEPGDRLEFLIHRVDTAIEGIRSVRRGTDPPAALQVAPWWKEEEIQGAWSSTAELAEFVGLYVVNDGPDAARHVWAELEFLGPTGAPLEGTELRTLVGRWSQAPKPEIGSSPEAREFTEIDIEPNGRPEPLDVAVRFKSDQAVYAMNTRNLLAGGRQDIFLIPEDTFEVRVSVRAVGEVSLLSQWSCSRSDFRLKESA